MNDDEWNDIMDEAKEGECGPWMCPECDGYTVELGERFEQGQVVELTLMCVACEAQVVAPA
ncbi:hypothetical protein [Spongiactinospora rosea]|uniref:hypothetical protein n=1 Tax=Spongiactinospora rosea TaxID=2248750 RepID=UPI0011C055BB|nr:hypothetical protein [Spongiactinospora rosea]